MRRGIFDRKSVVHTENGWGGRFAIIGERGADELDNTLKQDDTANLAGEVEATEV
ncbi:MAG: hypothetical protein IKA87_10560 [Lentisphaeria bacterium]|nr:hypothetical protein [Lentisphaeria bacterium]